MKNTTMKTLIRKALRELGFRNGETLDMRAQITLSRSCAGDTPEKVSDFHRAFREMTTGNHIVSGSPLTLTDRYL